MIISKQQLPNGEVYYDKNLALLANEPILFSDTSVLEVAIVNLRPN